MNNKSAANFLLDMSDLDTFVFDNPWTYTPLYWACHNRWTCGVLKLLEKDSRNRNDTETYEQVFADFEFEEIHAYHVDPEIRKIMITICGTFKWINTSEDCYERTIKITEDEAATIRYSVFFARSLTSQLLICLSQLDSLPKKLKI
jgi:hypothetical protein